MPLEKNGRLNLIGDIGAVIRFFTQIGIMIFTVGIVWGTLSAKVEQLEKNAAFKYGVDQGFESRLRGVETNLATAAIQISNLGDVVGELRQEQNGLRKELQDFLRHNYPR